MKEIRFLLLMLSVAAFTSIWWLAIVLTCSPLLAADIILSVLLLGAAIIYIESHWKDKDRGMKEIKFLLQLSLPAIFTSIWWIAVSVNNRFLPLTIILSVFVVVAALTYLSNHWNDDKYQKINDKLR